MRNNEDPASMAGIKKLSNVAEGFSFYQFEWLGDKPYEWEIMKLTGCVFRAAKSGPNKGKFNIRVEGTKRTAFISRDELQAEMKEKEERLK